MGVVIVQTKATAHVYRVFGALVVLLVVLAVAVAVTRFRSDQTGASPYGTLASVAASRPSATAALPAGVTLPTLSSPPATPATPAQTAIAQAAPPSAPSPSATAPVSPGAIALVDPSKAPRMIALDKAAATALMPQPAPLAVVEAAAKAAAVPPAATAATPAPVQPAAATPQVATAADMPAPEAKPAPPGGLVNINRASIDQLDHLGGGRIGASIARHRPYRSIGDLVSHRVLKARDFARIQSAITTE